MNVLRFNGFFFMDGPASLPDALRELAAYLEADTPAQNAPASHTVSYDSARWNHDAGQRVTAQASVFSLDSGSWSMVHPGIGGGARIDGVVGSKDYTIVK
jgi:hypothetical protein